MKNERGEFFNPFDKVINSLKYSKKGHLFEFIFNIYTLVVKTWNEKLLHRCYRLGRS